MGILFRGDQNVRSKTGYKAEDGIPRLNILEVQRLIRFMPKVVIAVVLEDGRWALFACYMRFNISK